MRINTPRFQLIILGLIGYFLITLGGYLVFVVWLTGLFLLSRLAQRESLRYLLLSGVAINLILGAIVLLGLDGSHRRGSFWTDLKHEVIGQLILAAIVAVILVGVFVFSDGRFRR